MPHCVHRKHVLPVATNLTLRPITGVLSPGKHDLSSGVQRFSIHAPNYKLLIMMPSNHNYMNQDGVVHHDFIILTAIAIIRKLVYSLFVLFVIVTVC